LASMLRRYSQSVFYLESLDVQWLPTRVERWLSETGIVVATLIISGLSGLAVGLVSGLIFELNATSKRLHAGLSGGLMFSLAGWLSVGLSVGLIGGLLGGLVVGLVAGLTGGLVVQMPSVRFRVTLVDALIGSLQIGLIAGPIFALITLLSSEAMETRIRPNQGTRRSLKMAIAALSVGALFGGLVGILMCGPTGLLCWLIFGLMFGLIFGLFGGGLFCLKHLVLRLVLATTRSAPVSYVRFLDHAVERLFLRKVGGGYIFSHRMLLEYFASLAQPHRRDQDAVKLPR